MTADPAAACPTCRDHPGHRIEFCAKCGKESHILGGTPGKRWICWTCLEKKR
jgi:hypothetical protein